MHPVRIVVFLPCHTLDDFPTWLEEADADDVLAAWTAAWDPRVIAAIGRPPEWASVDLRPPADEPVLGIVPAAFDERFAAQADAACTSTGRWVRGHAPAGVEEDAEIVVGIHRLPPAIVASPAAAPGAGAAATTVPPPSWTSRVHEARSSTWRFTVGVT